jgi:hypothetical protein
MVTSPTTRSGFHARTRHRAALLRPRGARLHRRHHPCRRAVRRAGAHTRPERPSSAHFRVGRSSARPQPITKQNTAVFVASAMNISVNMFAPFASWYHTERPCTMAGALERAQAPQPPSPSHQPPPPLGWDRLEELLRHVARLARSSPSNSDPAISVTIMNSHIFASLHPHRTTSMHALHSCPWDEVTHGDTVTHRQVM